MPYTVRTTRRLGKGRTEFGRNEGFRNAPQQGKEGESEQGVKGARGLDGGFAAKGAAADLVKDHDGARQCRELFGVAALFARFNGCRQILVQHFQNRLLDFGNNFQDAPVRFAAGAAGMVVMVMAAAAVAVAVAVAVAIQVICFIVVSWFHNAKDVIFFILQQERNGLFVMVIVPQINNGQRNSIIQQRV